MNPRSPWAPSGRTVLAALAGTSLVFVVTHLLPLPGTLHAVMTSNGGRAILDLRPTFSSQEVYQRLASFGEAGREAYLRMMLSMDILFPLVFTLFLGLLALYAIGRRAPGPPPWFVLSLPLGYLVADLTENLSIAWLIQDYPNRHDGLASALGYITAAKRACMYAALFFPLGLLFLSLTSGRAGKR